MVSNNPNPADGFYLDPTGMALPGLGTLRHHRCGGGVGSPYTITKSRESWTEPEHDKFLEALQLFDRDWKKIEAFVGSKTVIQIRSHAQKYFQKVQKNGTNEHLPPPRPKRKAAHPYPQKASKNARAHPQVSGSFQSSTALVDTGPVLRSDPSLMLMDPITTAASSSWTNNEQTISFSQAKNGPVMVNKPCGSVDSTLKTGQTGEITHQENHGHALRGLYHIQFFGSVFDPNTTSHLQKLKKMDPIDVETVLLLMRNLSINLTSPDFEDHRKLLSSYEIDTETIYQGGACKAVGT
ncbi:hypothetical protein GQ457_17G025280 [Hibiscus cannabinus]